MPIEFCKETTPLTSVDYFSITGEDGNQLAPARIATVTVFYNEDGFTLENTMRCLNFQQDIDAYGQDLLLVGDGLEQMSSSMAEYLSKIFKTETIPLSFEAWPEWANTCIVKMGPDMDLWRHGRVCLVLKKYNKGKWNSHEWHMRSFANDAEFCFLTDVGCQYNTDLMSNFLRHLEDNAKCVAVTGRRYAQTEFQQCDPCSPRKDTLMQSLLRAVQSHMFENENNNKIENLIGCIPILHGHCTFYHWSKVTKDAAFIDFYFRLAYKSPAEIGFLMAQLRLAEDSVQAMYLLTHIPNAETSIVENALFYFDVETTWEKFAKQRRRWNNSNVSASKYLLCGSSGHPPTIWGSSMPLWKKLAMSFCMLRWIFTLISMKFMISVYAMVLFKCSMVLCKVFLDAEKSLIICSGLLTLYFYTYIGFVFTHVKRFGADDCSFDAPVWTLSVIINTCAQIITLSLIPMCFLVDLPEESVFVVLTMTLVGIIVNILPWVRTSYMDTKTAINVIGNIPMFVGISLMGSMVNGFLPAYYLARAMDLSWGNRPGLDMQLADKREYDQDEEDIKQKCAVEKCPQSVEQGPRSVEKSAQFVETSTLSESDDGVLCRDHSWMKTNIKRWKIVNAIVVCCNIALCIVIICTEYAIIIITVLYLAVNIQNVLILVVILSDIIKYITRFALDASRKSLACLEKRTSKISITKINEI